MSANQKLKIGVIGAGRIGRLHAGHLATRVPGAELLAIADIYLAAAQQTAMQFNIPLAVADYRQILDNPAIEAILICSATDTHIEIIEAASQAGKHIFCEKPIDIKLERIDRALQAVEKAGVKLQVGFNRRFDANYQRVRRAVQDGEIGQPHMMHIISRDPAPPPIDYIKVSGGIFLDMTIHDFDMARFLIDSEIKEVYVAGGVMVDPAIGDAGDLDTVLIVLKFENGVIATIDNSRKAVYGYDQRVEVFGSAGSISTGNNFPNTATIRGEQTIHRDLPLNFFMERYIESYVNEMQAFIDVVLNDESIPAGGLDGRISVQMGLAARRSYDENRPVRLDEV